MPRDMPPKLPLDFNDYYHTVILEYTLNLIFFVGDPFKNNLNISYSLINAIDKLIL